jgi:hypothetical protein
MTAHPVVAPPDVADAVRAEGLLFDLAGELRRAPVHKTLRIHLRALQMKRVVTRWYEQPPDEASSRAVIEELLSLQREVREIGIRSVLAGLERRSGPSLATL